MTGACEDAGLSCSIDTDPVELAPREVATLIVLLKLAKVPTALPWSDPVPELAGNCVPKEATVTVS